MLKAMRRNVKSLKPTMWIVIVTFIIAIFAVWGGASRQGEEGGTGTLAFVGKRKISQDAYLASLRQRIDAMRKDYPDLNRAMIQQLNLPQQTLEEMVTRTLLLETAKEMNLAATDAEIRERIVAYPVFQRDGKFIGFDEYRRILNWNRISIGDFESGLRSDILLNKVVQFLTAGVAVTPDEIWDSYRKENETAKVEYLVLEKDKVDLPETPPEAELQAYFERNKASYQVPEKREGGLVLLNADDLKTEVKISDADIASYYKDNLAQFQTPASTRVSRIWFPFESRDQALVRAEAQSVLDRVAAGEDFAELAKKFSKDDKASAGGDWGMTDWRSLSAAEQSALEPLAADDHSGLVDAEDGLAILRVAEKTAETTPSIEEVKDRIRTILEDEKSRALADERAAALAKQARREKSLDAAAQRMNLKPRKTGLLKTGQPFEEIDPSGTIAGGLFGLKPDEVSEPLYTYDGVAVVQLRRVEPAHAATFAEVREDVLQDLTRELKKDRIRERIAALRLRLLADVKTGWPEIAKEEGLAFNSINEHKREQYVGTIGESARFDEAAFGAPLGTVADPVEYENGYALVRVLDRKTVGKDDLEKVEAAERDKLLEAKKNKVLQSSLARLREEKKVRIKYDLFLRLNEDLLGRFSE
ncbi:MAG: peptidyl-prolyl cis-trans isomerase [Candidatus Aminicenantes bacterium]|nr:peptidyl-prolyl cis-trans isomerase [Candidatus Aminicenantes bacterium]